MSEPEVPRIGPEVSEGEKLYYQFMDTFQDGLEACMKTGQASRLIIGMGERNILVQISEAGKGQEEFDKLLGEIAKGGLEIVNKDGKVIGNPTELEPT